MSSTDVIKHTNKKTSVLDTFDHRCRRALTTYRALETYGVCVLTVMGGRGTDFCVVQKMVMCWSIWVCLFARLCRGGGRWKDFMAVGS